MKLIEVLRRTWKANAFSPEAFIARAVIITILYAISRLAGLQEYTTFLSGTSPNLNMSWQMGSTLGLIHLLLYFGFVLAAPIFLLTACILFAWDRLPKKLGICQNS